MSSQAKQVWNNYTLFYNPSCLGSQYYMGGNTHIVLCRSLGPALISVCFASMRHTFLSFFRSAPQQQCRKMDLDLQFIHLVFAEAALDVLSVEGGCQEAILIKEKTTKVCQIVCYSTPQCAVTNNLSIRWSSKSSYVTTANVAAHYAY